VEFRLKPAILTLVRVTEPLEIEGKAEGHSD
jgi:hypothetical protein